MRNATPTHSRPALGSATDSVDTARWFKFAIPLLCATLALLSVPFALGFARAGGFAGVLIALTLTLVAQLFLLGAQGLAITGRLPALAAAVLPAALFLALALTLLRRRE